MAPNTRPHLLHSHIQIVIDHQYPIRHCHLFLHAAAIAVQIDIHTHTHTRIRSQDSPVCLCQCCTNVHCSFSFTTRNQRERDYRIKPALLYIGHPFVQKPFIHLHLCICTQCSNATWVQVRALPVQDLLIN